MAKNRIEVGKYNGEKYTLRYEPMSEWFPHITTKEMAWHLWLGNSHEGCHLGTFSTKAAAMEELDYAVRALELEA